MKRSVLDFVRSARGGSDGAGGVRPGGYARPAHRSPQAHRGAQADGNPQAHRSSADPRAASFRERRKIR